MDTEDGKRESASDSDSTITGKPFRGMVTSFDLGMNATAFCVGWKIQRVGESRTRTYVHGIGLVAIGHVGSAIRAVEAMWDIVRRIPAKCGVVLVEEQPMQNAKTCMLEVALSALSAAGCCRAVIHVPVSRVSAAFDLPTGRTKKKRAAVNTVISLVQSSEIVFSIHAASMWKSLTRKHDVADAILQLEWYTRGGMDESPVVDALACASTVPRVAITGALWCAESAMCARATSEKNRKQEEKRREQRTKKAETAITSALSAIAKKKYIGTTNASGSACSSTTGPTVQRKSGIPSADAVSTKVCPVPPEKKRRATKQKDRKKRAWDDLVAWSTGGLTFDDDDAQQGSVSVDQPPRKKVSMSVPADQCNDDCEITRVNLATHRDAESEAMSTSSGRVSGESELVCSDDDMSFLAE